MIYIKNCLQTRNKIETQQEKILMIKYRTEVDTRNPVVESVK